MTTSVTMTLEEAVEAALDGRKNQVLCPAHDDKSPSLSVAPGTTQPVVFNCHAGCDPEQVIEAGGLDWAKVSMPTDPASRPDHSLWTPAGTASDVYHYCDESGELLFDVFRVPLGEGKRFMQCHPDTTAPSGRAWNLEGVRRVLYRLPDVLRAVREGRTVHLAEGEKCANALQAAIPSGEQATCNPMGAGKWTDDYSHALAGGNVIIYADADEVGRLHARVVRESLMGVGCTVRIVEPPPGLDARGKVITDVADHLAAGHALEAMLETTPESAVERARTGFDILDVINRPLNRVEFVIPNTLAKGERLILLGFEGSGKSTLCRQIAVCVAAGVHPFSLAECEPKRVLFIDAENHPTQVQESWVQLVGLAAFHNRPVERGMLTVLEEFEGLNTLDTPDGAAWLTERINAYKPDLVVMGPLTNMAGKDLRDDEPVRRIKNAVNHARSVCNSAFVMEHHAPLKGSMDKERPLRPYGSSLFLKWPDYGYGIKPTDEDGVFEWHKNRGPRVRSRIWPDALREGRPNTAEWPWMETVLGESQRV